MNNSTAGIRVDCRISVFQRVTVLFAVAFVFPTVVFAQAPDRDVAIEVSDLGVVERIESLFENDRIDEALDLFVPLVQGDDPRPMLVEYFDEPQLAKRWFVYWPVQRLLQQRFVIWSVSHPDWLVAYRERTDRDARVRLAEAVENDDSNSLEILAKYRLNSDYRKYANELATLRFERGDFQTARSLWLELCPQGWLAAREQPGTDPVKLREWWERVGAATGAVAVETDPALKPSLSSGQPTTDAELVDGESSRQRHLDWVQWAFRTWQVPLGDGANAANRDVSDYLAKLAVVSIAEGQWARAGRELDLLAAVAPGSELVLQGRQVNAEVFLRQHLRTLEQAAPEKVSENNTTRLGADLGDSSPLRLLWRADLRPSRSMSIDEWGRRFPNTKFRLDSLVGIKPAFRGDAMIWSEGDRIRAIHRIMGTPFFPQYTSDDESSELKGEIWASPVPEPSLGDDRTAIGRSLRQVRTGELGMVANVGDPRTIQQSKSRRTRSRIIALDWEREGAVATGFPLTTSDDDVEFEGTPLVVGGRMLVLRRRSQRDAQRSQLELICYVMKAYSSERTWQPEWVQVVAAADSMSQGVHHEWSNAELRYAEGTVLLVGSLGVVASYALQSGRVQWLTSYPRSTGVEGNGSRVPWEVKRAGAGLWIDGQDVFALPQDSTDLMCVDRVTGVPVWRTRLDDAERILTVTRNWVIVGGVTTSWIRRSSGQRVCRYPNPGWSPQSNLRWPANAASGVAAVDDNFVYVPVGGELHRLTIEPTLERPRVGRTRYVPNLVATDQLSDEEGRQIPIEGDLYVDSPYLWIVGPQQVQAARWNSDSGVGERLNK